MRKLLLMRHAKSDRAGYSGADFDRPLAARGRRDAPRMGKWLTDAGYQPDRVVTSPAKRAKETALAIAAALQPGADQPVEHPRIYEASIGDLLDVLADQPVVSSILLIGHNPGLEELLWYLLPKHGETAADAKQMPTAAIACLELADDWSSLPRGRARLIAHMRPRSLPDS